MLVRFSSLSRAFVAMALSLILVFAATLSASAVTPSSGPVAGGTTVTIDGIEFVQISTTMSHTLALTNQGTVFAWGNNSFGALGDGTTTNSSTPVQVKGVGGVGYLTGVTSIATGGWFSLAVTADGVVSWGLNSTGQLGDGTTTNRPTPVAVVGTNGTGRLTAVTKVVAGYGHSVALTSSGVYTWGNNFWGQLGNATTNNSLIPTQVKDSQGTGILSGVTDIAAGGMHTLANAPSGLVAWGFNADGELGINNQTSASLPVQVLGLGGSGHLTGVTCISAGENFSLAAGPFGVYAWGDNTMGQLGNGTTNSSLIPTQVVGVGGTGTLQNVTALGSGVYSSYAVSSSSAVGWGNNSYGALGDDSATTRTSPVQILGVGGTGILENVTSIDGGEYFAVAVASGATVEWGDGYWMGNGSNSGSYFPILAANFQPATITFGSIVGTNVTASQNQWSVVSPSGSVGTVALAATANVFGGTTPGIPSSVTWDAGTFTYEAALANTGAPNNAPLFIGSGIAVLLGVGLLIALRRQNRK